MGEDKKWIITLSGKRSINTVKKEISASGFKIEQVLDGIGCIIGDASDVVIAKVRKVDGISDVAKDPGEFNIGPPDAPITW